MSKFIANSFQLPNAFVDEMLCKLSGNACKIYLLIVRKTRGWHKEADRISYSQIQKYTGINHRATVSKAIDELLEVGLISVQKGNEKSMSEYRLNDDFCGSKNEPVKKCTSSKNEPTGSKNEQEAGSKNEHTEIHYIKNTKEKYNEYDTHTHQNFENSQTAKPNKSTGKSPSAKKFITADELVSLGVDDQVANDYLATRKTKLTQTALSGIAKQATLAGVSLAKAIEFACEMGWQSFKADWYQNAQTKFGNPQPTSRMDELRHMANTNPTNVFVDDLPPNFDALGVNYE
ncbi:phage replication protein O, N-terminal domain [Moraxella lacunata]|uniref:Phage replication protein O, N-terminal domain n=1 Tax=Moraxella lacunata TaxID=477 RepID=A0A378T406_MORLA|nr:replication protein [Moraxella lacunata]STZ55558.1 phage replication protein O, N-terminal domain [Moraxella lacunata]